MLKKILPLFLIIIFFSFLAVNVALADCNCTCNDNYKPPSSPVADEDACIKICTARGQFALPAKCTAVTTPSGGPIKIEDPLKVGGGPEKLYARIITALLSFVGIASLVAFVYAGFVFLISAGNPERVKKAKDTMLYAVIGIFVAMASYAILSFIFTTLEGATGQ